ncbi:hypothetical protein [Microvirga thermotolerans]|nr:hypothetical protein [Microvirga thermotolerans]
MKLLLKRLSAASLAAMLMPAAALADETALAGSMWTCTRARDGSQFLIVFYPDGGVGGGEVDKGAVSPYVFDASRTPEGRWPGRWGQTGADFTWEFPDQHMRIEGRVAAAARGEPSRLTGTETALELASPVACIPQAKAPRIGPGLVIPQDGHFIDPDDKEGALKVPAGVSLQPQPRRR